MKMPIGSPVAEAPRVWEAEAEPVDVVLHAGRECAPTSSPRPLTNDKLCPVCYPEG